MVARRATLSESEAFRNEAEKTTREETKTTRFVDVDRNILVTETEEGFLHAERK